MRQALDERPADSGPLQALISSVAASELVTNYQRVDTIWSAIFLKA
jgi:hypothetical protein